MQAQWECQTVEKVNLRSSGTARHLNTNWVPRIYTLARLLGSIVSKRRFPAGKRTTQSVLLTAEHDSQQSQGERQPPLIASLERGSRSEPLLRSRLPLQQVPFRFVSGRL